MAATSCCTNLCAGVPPNAPQPHRPVEMTGWPAKASAAFCTSRSTAASAAHSTAAAVKTQPSDVRKRACATIIWVAFLLQLTREVLADDRVDGEDGLHSGRRGPGPRAPEGVEVAGVG